MTDDQKKMICAIENCISVPKCRDCPWEECEEQHVAVDGIPLGLMHEALAMLEAQEQRHRLEVHNIGNVDIPDGVTNEQFHAVMNNVVAALEHTDRGESWPYEPPKEG